MTLANLDLIEKAGLLEQLKRKRGCGLKEQIDDAGNSVWFATIAMSSSE